MNNSLSGSESGLVAYYKMSDGSGTSLADSSSNSHTATLYNMTNADWVDGNASCCGGSELFNITNISGHTKEDGTTATFKVALKNNSRFPSVPSTEPIGFCHSDPNNSSWYLAKTEDESGWSSGDYCYTSSGSVTPHGGQSCIGGSGLTGCISACDSAGINCNSSDFFTISAPSNSGHTREDGTTSTFNVALKSAPSSNVTVSVSSSDTGEASVSSSSLTFTPGDWTTPQTVIVTGVDDSNMDGHQYYAISLSSTAEGYVTDITDSLSESAYSITSGSSPGSEQVQYAFDGSTNTKYLNYSGQGTGVVINTGSSLNTVTKLGLTTANDSYNRDPTEFSLYGSINGSSWVSIVTNESLNPPTARNTNYSDVSFSNSTAYQYYKLVFTKTRQLYDLVQIAEIRLGGSKIQNHSANVMMLNLDDDAKVIVNLESSDTGEATVSPDNLTFTEDNWDTPRTVTLTGKDDTDLDGHQDYQVSLSTDDPSENGTGSSSSQSTMATQPPLQNPGTSYLSLIHISEPTRLGMIS